MLEWSEVKPLRGKDDTLEATLADVECHMPAGHPYRDSRHVTWAHETTHGLNARIRNRRIVMLPVPAPRTGMLGPAMYLVPAPAGIPGYSAAGVGGMNACYVLKDRAFVAEEPPVSLSEVAGAVPSSMRGMSYQLYLVSQQQYWQNEPLYVFDEWSAYANGLSTALDAGGGDGSFSDVLQTVEFTVYSFVLFGLIVSLGFDVDHFRGFVEWQAERCTKLYLRSVRTRLDDPQTHEHVRGFHESSDTRSIRDMLAATCGASWVEDVFRRAKVGEGEG